MFKKVDQLQTYKKYVVTLRAGVKRLRKMQDTQNSGDKLPNGAPQTSDVMLYARYVPEFTFADAKKPKPMLLIGKKTTINAVYDTAVTKRDPSEREKKDKEKGAKDKGAKDKEKDTSKATAKGAKGYFYWNAPESKFHLLVKGPVKLAEVGKILKKAGYRDRVVLGDATDEVEQKALVGAQRAENLDLVLLDEPEPTEAELAEIDPNADDDEEEGQTSGDATTTATATTKPTAGEQSAAVTAWHFKDQAKATKSRLDVFRATNAKPAETLIKQFAEALKLSQTDKVAEGLNLLKTIDDTITSTLRPKEYAARLKKLTSDTAVIVEKGDELAKSVQEMFAAAAELEKQKPEPDYVAAAKKLDEIEAMVAQAAKIPKRQEWEAKLIAVSNNCDKARGNHPEKANALMKLLDYANAQASIGDYKAALEVLKKLDETITIGNLLTTTSTAATRPGTKPTARPRPTLTPHSSEEFKTAKEKWDKALEEAAADLEKLVAAIRDEFKDESKEENEEANAAADELATVLDAFQTELSEKLDHAMKAQRDDTRAAYHRAVAAVVSGYRGELDRSSLIKDLDTNPFTPVSIHKKLSDTLGKLGTTLGV
jgi:hypothetical protein